MTAADCSHGFFGSHSRTVQANGFTCTLSVATVPKEELPEHRHPDAHFIMAIDRGYLSRAFDADEQGAGFDLIYNPPGTVHRDCFYEPAGRYLSIAVPATVSATGDAPIRLKSAEALAAAKRILGLCAGRDNSSPLQLEDELMRLTGALSERPVARSSLPWIRQANELIHARATEGHLTIALLASELGLHPTYFARAYKAALGYGPAKAVQARRLAAATAMLSRDIGLAEIASECGFADQSHLSRSMQAAIGVSPKRLRDAFG